MDNLSVFDLIFPPFYLVLFLIIGNFIKKNNIEKFPEYEFFLKGLIIKIIGAIALGLIYSFYYNGGDTINYFQTANAYVSLSFYDFNHFIEGWLGNPIYLNSISFFNDDTGYPVYFHRDQHSFFIVRLLIPIVFLAGKTYFSTAILTAFITFSGVWKLYQMFVEEFPELKKELAIAIVFLPSCVFWGSGILKDSFTLSAVGWFSFSFYKLLIKRKFNLKHIISLVVSSTIMIAVKPYIFFALLPGSILWLSNNQIAKISNSILRVLIAPFLITLGLVEADYYGGKTFDIGEFDASIEGIALKAPQAIFAGLFRPGIWDVKNAVMLISSLENTILLFLTIFLLIKLKVFGFFKYISKYPMIMFAMLFALFFSFAVGLTVANFGSLVRLRIPSLPFYMASIFIIRHFYNQSRLKK